MYVSVAERVGEVGFGVVVLKGVGQTDLTIGVVVKKNSRWRLRE